MSEDINIDTIKNTQKLLGKFVKKPALTEKLLRKPPFRFLHDIVTCIIRDTGFLKGLYKDEELISDNVKEKESKIKFLTKLIDAVKSITGKEIKARPNRIVAGLEPTETNNLLQTIGRALERKLDSSEYVKSINKTSKTTNDFNKKEKKKAPSTTRDSSNEKKAKVSSKTTTPRKNEKDENVPDSRRIKKKENVPNLKSKGATNDIKKESHKTDLKLKNNKETKIESERGQGDKEKAKESEGKAKENEGKLETVDEIQIEKITNNDEGNNDDKFKENKRCEKVDDNFEEEKKGENTGNDVALRQQELKTNETVKETVGTLLKRDSATVVRPKSAKPRSSRSGREKVKQEVTEILTANKEEDSKPNEVSGVSNQPLPQRPYTSSLRPPSVRPSSARPGPPRLKPDPVLPLEETVSMRKVIVENFDKNKDSDSDVEEPVTVEVISPPEIITRPLDLPTDKGHLVEQILEQLHDDVIESDGIFGKKPQVEIEWEQEEGLRGKDAVSKETEQVRVTLQTLTKSANPLGKMIGYLHEDIDAMHAELNMWWESRKQAEKEIEEQKRAIDEEQKPLLAQLEVIKENVEKYKKQIAIAETNTLQNERRIHNLLLN